MPEFMKHHTEEDTNDEGNALPGGRRTADPVMHDPDPNEQKGECCVHADFGPRDGGQS